MMDQTVRYFRSGDLARLSSPACEGCGDCCRGMGDTIVLDPYDAHCLAAGLGKPFAEMIGDSVELHVENGVILPHLAMKKDACSFLGEDGRCRIHLFRPGICRLFPLAREFGEDSVRYFVLPGACPMSGRSKVRIDRWIGIPDMDQYENFKLSWHRFLKKAEAFAVRLSHEEQEKLSLFLLETFFLRPYEDDFYLLIDRRIKRAGKALFHD